MPETRQISNIIVAGIIPELKAAFRDVDDDEQIGVVKGGRLQENPTKQRIYACVHIGDPDDKAWRDTVVSRRDEALDRKMFQVGAYEVGGGTMWWRRFSVEWGFFGMKTKEDFEQAETIANLTKGRLEHAIGRSAAVIGQTDALGEVSILVLPVVSEIEQGGGKNSFIWRGKVQFQVLTQAGY